MMAQVTVKEQVVEMAKMYYGEDIEYYVDLAMEELQRGLTLQDVEELMKEAEL